MMMIMLSEPSSATAGSSLPERVGRTSTFFLVVEGVVDGVGVGVVGVVGVVGFLVVGAAVVALVVVVGLVVVLGIVREVVVGLVVEVVVVVVVVVDVVVVTDGGGAVEGKTPGGGVTDVSIQSGFCEGCDTPPLAAASHLSL